MMTIETERLHLHLLEAELIAAIVRGDLDAARLMTEEFEITDQTFVEDTHVLRLRHEQLTVDPGELPWLYRVAVHRNGGAIIGRVGFHNRPDAKGTVEIGFRTSINHRRQGYALEMARGLMNWGATQGARRCLASVRPDNTASLATIARLGFIRIGEHIDEIDGQEWVHQLEL